MKCVTCGDRAVGAFCDAHRLQMIELDQRVDLYGETEDLVSDIEPDDLLWRESDDAR